MSLAYGYIFKSGKSSVMPAPQPASEKLCSWQQNRSAPESLPHSMLHSCYTKVCAHTPTAAHWPDSLANHVGPLLSPPLLLFGGFCFLPRLHLYPALYGVKNTHPSHWTFQGDHPEGQNSQWGCLVVIASEVAKEHTSRVWKTKCLSLP